MPCFDRPSFAPLVSTLLAAVCALGAACSSTPTPDDGGGGTGSATTATSVTSTTSATATTSAPATGSTATGAVASCATACERAAECSAAITVDACVTGCEAETPARRDCVLACDRTDCTAFLACVTACGADHDGNNPYGACNQASAPGPDCPAEVSLCYISADDVTGALIDSVCIPSCASGPCPAALSGTAVPTCSPEDMGTCYLDCANGATCPDGMICSDLVEMQMCVWPY